MKKLIIIRGLPGSGKSYLVKEILFNLPPLLTACVCSNDKFWIDKFGRYKYSASFAKYAKDLCRGSAARAMYHGTEIVIIDNTNINISHMQPYLEMADEFDYEVEIREPQTLWAKDPQECAKRNVHGVPLEIIQSMAEGWQDIHL
jgi:predicted kinase